MDHVPFQREKLTESALMRFSSIMHNFAFKQLKSVTPKASESVRSAMNAE